MSSNPATPPADRQWYIVSRWEEFEGEGRANLLRVIAVTAFYAVELINYYGLQLGPLEMPPQVDRPFHLAVTTLTIAWLALCLGIAYCRHHHVFPAGLKFVSTGADIVLLTTVQSLGDGPKSPLVVGYFLILATAGLRFDLTLLRCATAGVLGGYLYLLGFARWFAPPERAPLMRLPRYHQLIVVLALTLTGVILGQIIRRVHRLAEQYAARRAGSQGGQP